MITPVQRYGDIWVKRDDTWEVAGANGGKARTCWALSKGAKGLITAGSRASPQVDIVARIAHERGVPCRVHVPSGDYTPELDSAARQGAEVVQHRPGHNSVIIARAREDALALGWKEIPFGMECWEAIEQTQAQVANLPLHEMHCGPNRGRIVITVGSGMSLAGILWGLDDLRTMEDHDHGRIPVVGVVVGADPRKRLERYAPPGWRSMVTLEKSRWDYHKRVVDEVYDPSWKHFPVDPVYEAKALPYLRPGDLFWVVGIRPTLREAGQ